jgi:hypothetical protein
MQRGKYSLLSWFLTYFLTFRNSFPLFFFNFPSSFLILTRVTLQQCVASVVFRWKFQTQNSPDVRQCLRSEWGHFRDFVQIYSFKYNQQDATLYNNIYCCQCSTCFRRFFRPSGAQTVNTASGICQACLLLPLAWVSWQCQLTHAFREILYCRLLLKIFRENSSYVNIGQKDWELYTSPK